MTSCGLFDEKLNDTIQSKKAKDWDEQFCKQVYDEVSIKKIYITNLAKCTQEDARPLKDEVFKSYLQLFLEEMDLVKPKKIILFGNQVSSIILGTKISVSSCRKKSFDLKTKNNVFHCFPVFYPVGNGFFNAPKAVEDIKYIVKNVK